MNKGWKFYDGELADFSYDAIHREHYAQPQWIKSGNHGVSKWGYDDSDWQEVQIPHDFVSSRGQFAEHSPASLGSLVKGRGWYRKAFQLTKEDDGLCLSLEFDGVYRNCSVWLNGHFIGRHLSGYASFSFDITDVACYEGPNVVAVYVDASENEGWWYEGGGIYRDVRLVKTASLHIPQWGTFVQTELHSDYSSALITIQTEIQYSDEDAVSLELCSAIYDPNQQQVGAVSSSAVIEGEGLITLTQSITLENPLLWSITTPQLYTLHSRLSTGGQVVDIYKTIFGIREVRFDNDQGFLLNGDAVKLKGVCCHEDHAGVGVAVPKAVNEYRMLRLKEMGCNAYRSSHNPPNPAIVEACDRLGIVMIDEIRHTDTSEEALNQMSRLIRRDRNHPSIILWSLGNEEMNIQGRPRGVRILNRLQRLAHKLDPTRKCTYGMNAQWLTMTDFHELNGFHIDVHGFNYMMLRNKHAYKDFRAKYPGQGLLGTENASTLSTRGLYTEEQSSVPLHVAEHALPRIIWSNPDREGIVSAYGETYPVWGARPEEAWQAAAEEDYVAGLFVWTGFDYRGETFPYEWPSVVSRFGIMDLCGFAKDIYYYYQARWTDQPVLHLFPHWTWQGREGDIIDVWSYSNLEDVELFLNGRSLGKQPVPVYGPVKWQVPYEAGRLTACGWQQGKLVKETVMRTASEPLRLDLSTSRAELSANDEDVCIVQVAVKDQAGVFVPDADQEVSFTLEGPGIILGTGNGNPLSHEQDKAPQRRLYHGLCQVLVQVKGAAGIIKLKAQSPGLEAAQLVIQVHQADPLLPFVAVIDKEQATRNSSMQRDAADGGL
ncbi:beta-galactosidase GalA [Paenibacillus sp. JSM ZJ436]|uniref:beta-galactosidase GalA n=1 Tax=Paenibacillus sp. JSM ZJ436 TaxID=3376190 RepID=UPI0037913E45